LLTPRVKRRCVLQVHSRKLCRGNDRLHTHSTLHGQDTFVVFLHLSNIFRVLQVSALVSMLARNCDPVPLNTFALLFSLGNRRVFQNDVLSCAIFIKLFREEIR
jgi:hypothetical protein